ncbi:hypothetical protein D030_2815A, partial [Vibrio parahaemolyticus AQ3810]
MLAHSSFDVTKVAYLSVIPDD